jgi:flagellar assembly factor FliW
MIEISTTRFGRVEIEAEDIITLPAGLVGLENSREWVLLADTHNSCLAWFQSITRPELALAVVSPRRFVPKFQLRVARSELTPLELNHLKDARVLVIVGRSERSITLNLKAPLVINLQRRIGRQVINRGDVPLQYELVQDVAPLRKSA